MLNTETACNTFAFMGPAGSGKTTCCELLQQLGRDQGLKVVNLSFADPLKRLCSDLYCFAYNIPSEAFYGTQAEKEQIYDELGGRTGREILQFLGTACFKTLTPDVWIAYFLRHREIALTYGADLIVVDDLRFPDEADAVRQLGGQIIKVTKPGIVEYPRSNGHLSEVAHIAIDPHATICNDGNLIALQRILQRYL